MLSLAQRMARYAATLQFADLPPAAIHEAKRRIIDSLGCALGAWSAPCQVARRLALTMSAQNGSTLLGTAHKSPPDWAAFANGCLVRYLDYNDTYLSKEPAHPSDNIPAALAVAESAGSSGRETLVAITIAYETQCRLCDAASLRSIGWDHVTYGAFSTALAAARLLRLDEPRTVHALGIAGVASAALRQTRVGRLSDWKGCAFANAARHGVFAALLASQGMTGPDPIFEGDKGFQKLVSGPLPIAGPFSDAPYDPADCMILKTSIKCWPVEYHAQSAVEAALALRPRIPDPAQIASIVIDSHDAAVDIIGSEPEKWRPESRETADHSLPYITAAALVDGQVTPATFAPARFTDPPLLDLLRRTEVRRHPELTRLYPSAVANIVTVHLRDGRTLTHRIDYPLGHARNPMSDAQVEAKFRSLADPLLAPPRAAALLHHIWEIDRAPDVTGIVQSMRL